MAVEECSISSLASKFAHCDMVVLSASWVGCCIRRSLNAEPRSVAGIGVVLLLIVFTRGAMFGKELRVRMRRVPIEANHVARVG